MSGHRVASPGELCGCGRPAAIVITTEKFGEVGYCGADDGGIAELMRQRAGVTGLGRWHRGPVEPEAAPAWLNPTMAPDPETVAAIRAALDALVAIRDAVGRFVEHHGPMLLDWAASHPGLPDDVWPVVDQCAGYDHVFDLATLMSAVLTAVAGGGDNGGGWQVAQSILARETVR